MEPRKLIVEKRIIGNLREIAATNTEAGLDIEVNNNGTATVLQLNTPLSVEERARAPFEEASFTGAHIKSIQKQENLLIVETFGLFTKSEMSVVARILEAMDIKGKTDALYPAGTLLKKTNVFFSATGKPEEISTMGGSYISASTARIIALAKILVFTHGKELLSIPLTSIAKTKNWLQDAKLLAKANSEIVYLGRPEGNLLAISTESDVPYYVDVNECLKNQICNKKQIKGIEGIEEFRGAALIGRVRGNNIALMKKDETAVQFFPAEQFQLQQ
ncbi:MAG: hypothetical protein AAB596_00265 [Patescibacteria group bacterium]